MELTLAAARRILEPLLGGGEVASVTVRRGGRNSAVYGVSVAAPGQNVIIKVYPEHFAWKLHKEVYVYGLLSGHGDLPVPEVLAADDSRSRLPASYLVLTRLPGRNLADQIEVLDRSEVAAVYQQLGQYLRRIHEVTFEMFGYLYADVVDPHPTNAAYMRLQFTKKLASSPTSAVRPRWPRPWRDTSPTGLTR